MRRAGFAILVVLALVFAGFAALVISANSHRPPAKEMRVELQNGL